MRPTLWLSLVVLGLSAAAPGCAVKAKDRSKPPAVAGAPAQAPAWQAPGWAVEGGWKQTREEAIQDALEKARGKVSDYLSRQRLAVEWHPSRDYVREHLVRDLGKDETFTDPAGGEIEEIRFASHMAREEVKDFAQPVGTMRRVVVRVEVGPRDREEIQRQENVSQTQTRHVRAEYRQAVMGRLLAVVVALLAAVAAYLRLEDATKGYYTTLLRLAAFAFVACAAAGIWLLS